MSKYLKKDGTLSTTPRPYQKRESILVKRADEVQSTLPRFRGSKEQTICWKCRQADGSGNCSWANHLIPRTDWTAEKTLLRQASGKQTKRFGYDNNVAVFIESYIVRKCPGFKKEPKRKQFGVDSDGELVIKN